LVSALQRHRPGSGKQAIYERVLLVFRLEDKDVFWIEGTRKGGSKKQKEGRETKR